MKGRLPKRATAYIATTVLLGSAGVVDILLRYPLSKISPIIFPIVCLMGAFAGRQKVTLASGKNTNNSARISLGFITDLITLLLFGPSVALISFLSSMFSTLTARQKSPLYQTAFNISSMSLTIWILSRGLLLIETLTPHNQLFVAKTPEAVIAALLSTTVILLMVVMHLFLNAALVTGAVSLSMGWTRKKSADFFYNNTLWPAPTYLAAGCFMVMVVWLAHNISAGFYNAIPLGLVMLPQPLLYFYNLRLHRERDEEKEKRFDELESLYSSMVQAMGRAIEAKDRYTQEHISRVVAMSLAIGKRLLLSEEKLRTLEVGAALHDIGKIAIPDTVLNKPGKLTTEEFELIKEHAALGSEILQPVPFPPEVLEAVRHHHEKWDGTGYPDRLIGEQIPLLARIVAVADVYDALTSDRPYRAAWSHEKTMIFMSSQVGVHFNAEVFAAFEHAMEADPQLCSTAEDIEAPSLRLAA
ncbi:HD-GYP domain-containing protein [Armatimonas sp.]|uniref:HD-GYP domain-containing protein n=1 Tax=Armatimonas sp. TaxID=1872638 RepID=UPI00286B154B|nr:HD-GYP domain-containing protein [Armatimonas sp.]